MLALCQNIFPKCISYLLQIFGLSIPVEFADAGLYESKYWVWKQVYAGVISVTIILYYIYIEWLSSKTYFKVLRTSSIILLTLTHSSVTLICLLTVLGTAFWNKEKWGHYSKLQRILKSKIKIDLKRNRVHFLIEFILGHVFLFIVIGINQWRGYIFSGGELFQLLSIALKDALLYYLFLITIIVYNTILLLRHDFHAVKIFLKHVIGLDNSNDHSFTLYKPVEGTVIFPQSVVGDRTLNGLIEASKILNILFDCIDIFNKIFGPVILLFTMATVIVILSALNNVLVSAETNQLTADNVLDGLFEALLFLIWNSSILSASGFVKEESSEVVKLCCKLQHLVPQHSLERKELLNIAHQVSRQSPRISAAGFFDVDFFLILAVFTYVGTYIVVLIQFSHMNF